MLLAHFARPGRRRLLLHGRRCEQPTPLARQKEWQDSSTPSGNALAATALLRLGETDRPPAITSTPRRNAPRRNRPDGPFPTAAAQMLIALELHIGPTPEIVVLGDPAAARHASRPGRSAAPIHSQPRDRVTGVRRPARDCQRQRRAAPLAGARSAVRRKDSRRDAADGLCLRKLRVPSAGPRSQRVPPALAEARDWQFKSVKSA